MDTFRHGDLVFDVRDSGPADGEPVVLLHGFPQDAGAFDRLSPALHSAGLRTLAPDQRGYSPGARPSGRSAYRLRTVVDDVLAMLDAAGLPSAHVVGHDWGGIAAWALAAWHPWRVRTLTALSVPHPAAMSQALGHSDQGVRSAYVGFFQLPAVPEAVLLAGRGAVLRRTLRQGGLPAELVDRYVERMREPGALTAALNWYRALPLAGGAPVGTVRVPTLHLWGARDPFLGRTATEASASFVAAPYALEVLEDVGHWIPELAAERTAELVTAHVRTAGTPPR
ncbi:MULTISPECIES: alpha/beta fold hydrolase [unclassified Modestobacter]|uniref:alpha/beta fold hydrolase n=1 Tax=unclassified Modestobacter TaxID=2643866 RepID=UPI0022AA3F0B|nr:MULTISPECIES: alpha/beta fold hydrolase [unclassified Modestobacter]MCZ2809991.1 alpha/beta fold hydrolase [Modestobacter sp. VKM Ac-2979]MCZ2842594.1 alpha/beta fold hydrolase [Modestobacter sp. VKM Ac-2980]MCZ2847211.1 alpha/beta fold hydrolase [Modestobacter sp. VKM Ac-2978]